jgi:hypothetical protein
MSMIDAFHPWGGNGKQLRNGIEDIREDVALMTRGVLDAKSLFSGYTRVKNPVEVRVFEGRKMAKLGARMIEDIVLDDLGNVDRAHWSFRGDRVNFDDPRWSPAINQIRRTHNIQTNGGINTWLRPLSFGDITANSTGYTGVTGTATATSATSLTNSGAAFPTTGGANTGLPGHIVYCPVAGVTGTIVSNTATVLTVDQWTNAASATGAAGTTPGSTAVYSISQGAGPANWIGLCTDATSPSASDVLVTASGTFSNGATTGTITEQTANGLARAFVQPTLPSTTLSQFGSYTFTYTGSSSVVIAKAILCNSKAAVGSILIADTLLSATATVAASGDTVALTWTFTL